MAIWWHGSLQRALNRGADDSRRRAWYDAANAADLNTQMRDLYLQCEQAARKERRGLGGTTRHAAWDFRKAQTEKANAMLAGRWPAAETAAPAAARLQHGARRPRPRARRLY